jgi:hypothetical protein
MTEVRKNGVETNSTSSSSITSDDEGDQQVPTLVFSSRPSILGRVSVHPYVRNNCERDYEFSIDDETI